MNRAKPVLDARRPWSFIKARSMYHLRDMSDTRFGIYGRFICSIRATLTGQDDLERIINSVNTHDEMLAELRAADNLADFIEATLASVAVPSGHPNVSRAFADIRGALSTQAAKRRAAIARAEGRS